MWMVGARQAIHLQVQTHNVNPDLYKSRFTL